MKKLQFLILLILLTFLLCSCGLGDHSSAEFIPRNMEELLSKKNSIIFCGEVIQEVNADSIEKKNNLPTRFLKISVFKKISNLIEDEITLVLMTVNKESKKFDNIRQGEKYLFFTEKSADYNNTLQPLYTNNSVFRINSNNNLTNITPSDSIPFDSMESLSEFENWYNTFDVSK